MPPVEKKLTEQQKKDQLANIVKESFEQSAIAEKMSTLKKDNHLFDMSEVILLSHLRDHTKSLHDYATGKDAGAIADTIRDIQKIYPDSVYRLTNQIESSPAGTDLYKERMDMLAACNSTLAVAQQYSGFAWQNEMEGEALAKPGDSLDTVQDTLAFFSTQLGRVPKNGRDTMPYTEFYNVLEDATRGGSLENLYQKASAYISAREGILFSQFTDAGRHRMDMAKRVCEFLDNVNYKAYEPEIQKKREEQKAEIEKMAAAPSRYAAAHLDDKVMEKINEKCVDLHAAGKLEHEQRMAIVDKAKSCTFGQKEFILKFLETDNWVKGFLANGSSPAEIDRNFDRVLNGEELEISADEAMRRDYERQTGDPQEDVSRGAESHAFTGVDAPNTASSDFNEPEVLE